LYATIHYLRAKRFTKGYAVRRIAISGLVALAAVLSGGAVPATAMAQTAGAAAVRAGSVVAMPAAGRAPKAYLGEAVSSFPLISCVLATDCLGIEGTSSLSEGRTIPTRVARWDGSSWKGARVALPKGTKSDDLLAVSCKGAKSCLVVGDYYTSTSQNAPNHPLALIYNGTSLKTSAIPLPKGTTEASLTGVSCATTRYCVALGAADGYTRAFGQADSLIIIETWNGTKWSLHTAAASLGSITQVDPTVVSCVTTAFCVLAGQTNNPESSPSTFYVASWNGRKLAIMKPAAVGGSAAGFIAPIGVSCATASNCAVTGADMGATSGNSVNFTAFTEIWNGKTWQVAKVTWPTGTGGSMTMGVSCYAAHSCEAVGVDGPNIETSFEAAAVSFNGTEGTLQAVPPASKGYLHAFTNVSCLPSGSCVAIGTTGKATASSGAPLTGVWNGKSWKLEPGF
jgi:hypothetical protein